MSFIYKMNNSLLLKKQQFKWLSNYSSLFQDCKQLSSEHPTLLRNKFCIIIQSFWVGSNIALAPLLHTLKSNYIALKRSNRLPEMSIMFARLICLTVFVQCQAELAALCVGNHTVLILCGNNQVLLLFYRWHHARQIFKRSISLSLSLFYHILWKLHVVVSLASEKF